ncbi:MAG: PD-(D/E)XK nuclease family protein [Nitrosopumilus sp.]|nr:PD-(D/E)XK nuclease family protein [Nitrosopumilus sp.]
MIKIKKEKNITFLSSSVTDFADSLGYCEYKIPLSIKGIRPRPTQALIQGTKAHHEKEQYESEHVKLEYVTITEIEDKKKDIEFARENIYSTLTIPFEFPNEHVIVSLAGRIDKIMRVDGTLIVQDDKFAGRPQVYDEKTQPYPSQLLQVLAYLNSTYSAKRSKKPEDIFEMPHTEKQWQIRICDRKTREPYKIFSEIQDAFSLHYLHTSLERFTKIALDLIEPSHHESKRKCDACNLKSVCKFRI